MRKCIQRLAILWHYMASIMTSNIVGGLLFINLQLITLEAIYTFIMFLSDSVLVKASHYCSYQWYGIASGLLACKH